VVPAVPSRRTRPRRPRWTPQSEGCEGAKDLSQLSEDVKAVPQGGHHISCPYEGGVVTHSAGMWRMADAKILLGTCAFTASGWSGAFYPEGLKAADYLSFYAERFETVEIDSTWECVGTRNRRS